MSGGWQWKPAVLMVVVNFAFAIVNVLLKKVLDGGTDHMVIATYRLAICTIFLFPIACFWERKSRPKLTASTLCYLFIGALFGLTMTQNLFLLGLKYTSATFSCAFLNTVPVKTFILALIFRVEKLKINTKAGRAKVLGALICMIGAVVLTIYKGSSLTHLRGSAATTTTDITNHEHKWGSDKETQRWIIGSILLIAGCFSWSSWFLIQAKIGKAFPCQYSSTAILAFFGAVQSAILSFIVNRNSAAWILKGKLEILSIVYAGMVGSGLCYVGLSWCVEQKGPVFTSAFIPFTQIFAAVFDFSILHEQVYLGSVMGSVLVILGLYALLWGKSKDAEECATKQVQQCKEVDTFDAESQLPVTANENKPNKSKMDGNCNA